MQALVRSEPPWLVLTAVHDSCNSSVKGVQPDTLLVPVVLKHPAVCTSPEF
jgi:hypothetical protein